MSPVQPITEQVQECADSVTQRLKACISAAVPGISCSVLSGDSVPQQEGASLALLRVVPGTPPRDAASPLELRLEYLCTVTATDPLAAHRIVGEIAFAALAGTDYEAAPAPSGGTALVLSARLLRTRGLKPMPRVREPLRLNLQILGHRGEPAAAPGSRIVSLKSEE